MPNHQTYIQEAIKEAKKLKRGRHPNWCSLGPERKDHLKGPQQAHPEGFNHPPRRNGLH